MCNLALRLLRDMTGHFTWLACEQIIRVVYVYVFIYLYIYTW